MSGTYPVTTTSLWATSAAWWYGPAVCIALLTTRLYKRRKQNVGKKYIKDLNCLFVSVSYLLLYEKSKQWKKNLLMLEHSGKETETV